MRRHINSAIRNRMNMLVLLDDGWELRRVAEALYLDEGTVRECRRIYEDGGAAAIEEFHYAGHAGLLTPSLEEKLRHEVSGRVYLTSKEICAWVKKNFGIVYTPNAMTKLLKRLGFVHKKPKCVPATRECGCAGNLRGRNPETGDGRSNP